ncbi:Putative esterase [Ruminococcaceae bacterium YRB3002]|nr:Putative esterase [Ruminococcaceae bacterium YRB3002]
MKIKRGLTSLIIVSAMILSCSGCSTNGKLVNHMTDKELALTSVTELMLLDEPWYDPGAGAVEGSYDYFRGCVAYETGPDGLISRMIVHSNPYTCLSISPDYRGGAGHAVFSYDNCNAELAFDDYHDFQDQLCDLIDIGIADGDIERLKGDMIYNDIIRFMDALINGSAVYLEDGVSDGFLDGCSRTLLPTSDSFYWEFNGDEIVALGDSIKEYHFYDEELDMTFIVHVTTPPGYKDGGSYPAVVMTDAVWRLQSIPSLVNEMEEGRGEPSILITLGLDYSIDNWDNEVRANVFCDHKDEFLDFITDNMMPYLGNIYRIDYSRSCLFGHSQGGVFAHYAAFNSDRYENQPFSRYIVASPAFWSPYFTCVEGYEGFMDEYGYFGRNKDLGKKIIIVAGADEDPDYTPYYGESDTTLEGVAHLKSRLDGYGVDDYVCKIYDGANHFTYLSDMLVEYLDGSLK